MKGLHSQPLSNARDLDPLLERIGDARIVMLGEASHGTHEFYTWRTAISKRLVEEKGFRFIAVEGDWPDCFRVNRYVKGYAEQDKKPEEVLDAFSRWPTWMWANWEVCALIHWMRSFNGHHAAGKKVGFYGLDVYSLWESMETLLDYLTKTDAPAARIVEKALDCFSGAGRDEQRYAVSALSASCKKEVVQLLKEVRLKASFFNHDPEAALNTVQNAHIAVEAEKYYSNMLLFDEQTWNIRDRHMMDTLDRLLEFHGAGSKAIVWEHNTHIGDASFTNMKAQGLFNTGQLARERYPGQTFLLGFSSYVGTVMAADSWGAPMREMEMPAAREDSLEDLLRSESSQNRLLLFNGDHRDEQFDAVLPHRAIGVVYNPAHERGNYVPSRVNRRYDGLVYLDTTRALHPLHLAAKTGQVPETYPFGF